METKFIGSETENCRRLLLRTLQYRQNLKNAELRKTKKSLHQTRRRKKTVKCPWILSKLTIYNQFHPMLSCTTTISKINNCNTFYAHKSYISNTFKRTMSEYKGFLHCHGYDYNKQHNEVSNAHLYEPFPTKKTSLCCMLYVFLLSDGCMLYAKLGVDFFSKSAICCKKMIVGLQLIRARPFFCMTRHNPNVCFRIIDCFFHIRHFALSDDYHKKRKDMLS